MNTKNILSIIFLFGLGFSFAQLDRSKLPEPATPRPIEIGNYETFELKNGLKVFVIENHKLPRVSYNLLIDREPLLEGNKVGYLGMVGQMMRRGTETRTKEQIDEEVDFIGASLSGRSGGAFASGLSKYQEKIMELMTDIVFNPTFPEKELEKIRKQTISGLAANKEDPGAIAGNLNQKILYGSDHPYGEIQTEETTNNITVEDIRAYHSNFFKPNISYLAIVGDVNLKEMKKLVKKYFGAWEAGDVAKPTYEMPSAPAKNVVSIVNRANSVQSTVNITYPLSLPVASEDEVKVRVMNQVFGGSSTAKLFMNLREDKGYTYGSYSSLSSDELVARFNASAEVRNEVTDSAIVQIFYEMQQMRDGNMSDEEMDLAKNAISGSFSRSLERPQTVASFALNSSIYPYPDDYYRTYIQKVQAVTKEDVQAMAEKYLKPENAYINVVGKASEIEEKLKQFGELKYYDTYGNEVDPALAKLPAGLTAESVLNKYLEAVGGREKLAELKSVKMSMEASMMGQTVNMEVSKAAPNMSRLEVKMGGNVMQKQVFDGKKGKLSGMGGESIVEGDDALDMALSSAMFEEIVYLENNIDTELSGVENINGKDAYGIEVKAPSGKTSTRYYDVETGYLVRTTNVIEGPQGAMTLSTDLGDYAEYDGYFFPTTMKQPINPQMKMDINVTEVVINAELPADLFKIE
ncbi:MAG: insulinase family protein [Cyclobacteriaceae bacterium]